MNEQRECYQCRGSVKSRMDSSKICYNCGGRGQKIESVRDDSGNPEPPPLFFKSLLTTGMLIGGVINGTLREQDINEELFAQLMQTGRVRINNLIPNEVYSRMLRNVKEYHYGNEEVISKFEESIQKQYNISILIEDLLLSAIQNCKGEILFDIVSV